jgi:hypothetical protein
MILAVWPNPLGAIAMSAMAVRTKRILYLVCISYGGQTSWGGFEAFREDNVPRKSKNLNSIILKWEMVMEPALRLLCTGGLHGSHTERTIPGGSLIDHVAEIFAGQFILS